MSLSAQATWSGNGLAGMPWPSAPGIDPEARQTVTKVAPAAQMTGRQRDEGSRPVGNSRGRKMVTSPTVAYQAQVLPGQATAPAAGSEPGWVAA
jgi:hypothetical protein